MIQARGAGAGAKRGGLPGACWDNTFQEGCPE